MYIEKTLMNLNIYLFLIKDDELLKNTVKFGKTLQITQKKFDSEPVYNLNV